MNVQNSLIASLVLGSALVVGCEEQPEARPAPTTPPTTTTPPPDTGTTGANQEMQTRAQTLIQRFNQQVDSQQYDAAEQTLNELESMRSNLSQDMQQQIDDLRDELEQAKLSQPGGTTTPTTPPER